MHALIKVASHKEENGYCFNPETTIGIIFGEIKPPFESERVQAVCTLFENAQIHFRVTDYIKEEMWSKFRLNVCNNLPQAILGAGVGCYSDSTHMKAISEGLKKSLKPLHRQRVLTSEKPTSHLPTAVQCRQRHAIRHCRT